jgi:hypothetical protein
MPRRLRRARPLARPALAELRAQERQHVVRVGIAADHLLLEDELAVDVDVEDAARAGNEINVAERVFPLLENPRRQTDGVRARASGDAVLDADSRALGHD